MHASASSRRSTRGHSMNNAAIRAKTISLPAAVHCGRVTLPTLIGWSSNMENTAAVRADKIPCPSLWSSRLGRQKGDDPPGDAPHRETATSAQAQNQDRGLHDARRVDRAHGASRAAAIALQGRLHLDHRQHKGDAAAELDPQAEPRDAALSAIGAVRALGRAVLTLMSAVCALVTSTLTDTHVDAEWKTLHLYPSLASTILTLSYTLSLIGFHAS